MGNAANVQFLAQTEPWRLGQGAPMNCMDPIWAHDTTQKCTGKAYDIEWEPGTEWWWCRACGKVSNSHYLEHYVVEEPGRYFDLSLAHFMERRKTQGLPVAEAEDQAHHIMGLALRVAAAHRPEALARLMDSVLRLGE